MSQEPTLEQMSVQVVEAQAPVPVPSGHPPGNHPHEWDAQKAPLEAFSGRGCDDSVGSANPADPDILKVFSERMRGSDDREALLPDLFSKTVVFMNAEGGCLFEQDPGRQRLLLVAHKGLSDGKARHLSAYGMPIHRDGEGQGLWNDTPRSERAREIPANGIDNAADTPGIHGDISPEQGAFGGISWEIPIGTSDGAWGLLCFFGTRPAPAPDRLAEKSAALQKAWQIALDHMQWTKAARRQIEVLKMACAVAQASTHGHSMEQSLDDVVHRLAVLIGAQHAYLFSFSDTRNLLHGVAATHDRGNAVRRISSTLDENTLIALAAREKRPLIIQNAWEDPRVDRKWLRLFNTRCLSAIPLLLGERIVGVLLLDDARGFKRFNPQEVEALMELAAPITASLDHAIRHQAAIRRMDRLQSLSRSMIDLQEEERRRVAHLLRQEIDKRWVESRRGLEQMEKELAIGEPLPDASSGDRPQPAISPLETPSPLEQPQETPKTRRSPLHTQVRKLQTHTAKMRGELQRIANDLRPAMMDSAGLIPTLRWYVEAYSKRTRIGVNFQCSGMQKRMSSSIECVLYRLVQEALNNVLKHAQAKSVILNLERKDAWVHLAITDDGRGFDVRLHFASTLHGHWGLFLMKERVALLGGKLFIDSGAGQGTRLSIKLPMTQRTGSSGTP